LEIKQTIISSGYELVKAIFGGSMDKRIQETELLKDISLPIKATEEAAKEKEMVTLIATIIVNNTLKHAAQKSNKISKVQP
jgi:hypothetical protein